MRVTSSSSRAHKLGLMCARRPHRTRTSAYLAIWISAYLPICLSAQPQQQHTHTHRRTCVPAVRLALHWRELERAPELKSAFEGYLSPRCHCQCQPHQAADPLRPSINRSCANDETCEFWPTAAKLNCRLVRLDKAISRLFVRALVPFHNAMRA